MGYIAFAEISYDPREMLEILSRADSRTARGFLDKMQKIHEIEGRFLVREDGSLERANALNSFLNSGLPLIEAEVGNEISTIDYFAGVKGQRYNLLSCEKIGRPYPVMPHAHVTDGKGIIHNGAILDFRNVL